MENKKIVIGENMKEEKSHGSSDFPFSAYENQLDRIASGFVNWHWNNELQFCLVTKHEVNFSVELEDFILKPGQGIFINSGCLHRAKPVDYKDATYLCFNLTRDILASFPNSAIEKKYVTPYIGLQQYPSLVLSPTNKVQSSILSRLQNIYQYYHENSYGYELIITSELLLLWKDLTSLLTPFDKTDSIRNQVLPNRAKLIINYIHENYAYKVTLQGISEYVSVCPEECCRAFKEVTGCTIFEYLNDYRIKKSLELLKSTNMSINQISDFIGFSNPSYYIKQFKKINGITPKEFRNSL